MRGPRVQQNQPQYSPSTLIIFYDAEVGKEPLFCYKKVN